MEIDEKAFIEACKAHCRVAEHGLAHPEALKAAITAYEAAKCTDQPVDILLSSEEYKNFISSLENPPAPNKALREDAEWFKANYTKRESDYQKKMTCMNGAEFTMIPHEGFRHRIDELGLLHHEPIPTDIEGEKP